MPISDPLNVNISPKATSTLWWISPTGCTTNPATIIAHPKMHNDVARISCRRFIIQRLLATLNLLSHKVPHILIPRFVLCLIAERQLINRNVVWIHHTLASSRANISKCLSPSQLRCAYRRSTITMNRSVLSIGTLAIVVASSVLFRNFARDMMYRVFKNYLCHN